MPVIDNYRCAVAMLYAHFGMAPEVFDRRLD